MKFVFLGTDEFSVKVLETLKEKGLTPSLIISTPDKPKGRKLLLSPTPTKIWAEENKVDCIQPAKLKELETLPNEPYDFGLVASYGKIIPQALLDRPQKGTLNIHPSLLPKYRGPSPLQEAILNGDPETGVTVMLVDAEMDHGPILGEEKITLADQYDYEKLRGTLAVLGAELVAKVLPNWLEGKLTPQEQDHSAATYTRKFTKEDGGLKAEDADLTKYRKILAFRHWPGAYFFHEHGDKKIRVSVKSAHLEEGKLIFDRVIPEGRKEMDWQSFLNGLEGSSKSSK